jgi:hypothetical protein
MPQARHSDQLDPSRGMARLHAGLAVMPVVKDRDRQVRRPLDADRGESAMSRRRLVPDPLDDLSGEYVLGLFGPPAPA